MLGSMETLLLDAIQTQKLTLIQLPASTLATSSKDSGSYWTLWEIWNVVVVLSDAKADQKFSHILNWRVSDVSNAFIVITIITILNINFIVITIITIFNINFIVITIITILHINFIVITIITILHINFIVVTFYDYFYYYL